MKKGSKCLDADMLKTISRFLAFKALGFKRASVSKQWMQGGKLQRKIEIVKKYL